MNATLKLFDDLGISYVEPSQARRHRPLETCCNKFVERLIKQRGLPHMTLVLRAITESEGNAGELVSDVIGAVSDVTLAHPRWPNLGLQFIEALDGINLAQVRLTAKKTAVTPLRLAVATILCLRLEEILGPAILPKKTQRLRLGPKLPRSVTRIAEIEKSIAFGGELLGLRSVAGPCNKKFGHVVRRRYPDVDPVTVAEVQRVARFYYGLDDIWRRASWQTLIELSSPKMAPSIRSAFEDRILAGEKVTAAQVRKARGKLTGGSLKRALITPAPRMAA